MKEQALRYLRRDPLHFAGMLAALESPNTQIIHANSRGVLLSDSDFNFLSVQFAQTAKKLIPLLERKDVLAFEPILYDPLCKLGYMQKMVCYPCQYEASQPISFHLPPNVEIHPLSHKYDDLIFTHYHLDDQDYLLSRVDEGMFGIFERNNLAGFIGIHDNDEIGLLVILPAFRRKGYATLLESFMINHQLAKGRMPRGEVKIGNDASLSLQRKLGMTISDKTCAWFSIEANMNNIKTDPR